MTTRPHSISIRLDGAPVAIDLSDTAPYDSWHEVDGAKTGPRRL